MNDVKERSLRYNNEMVHPIKSSQVKLHPPTQLQDLHIKHDQVMYHTTVRRSLPIQAQSYRNPNPDHHRLISTKYPISNKKYLGLDQS